MRSFSKLKATAIASAVFALSLNASAVVGLRPSSGTPFPGTPGTDGGTCAYSGCGSVDGSAQGTVGAMSATGVSLSANESEAVQKSAGNRLQECIDDQKTAGSACGDPKSSAGMSSSEKAELIMALGSVASIAAQVAAAKGSSTACYAAAGLSGLLQTVGMLKGNSCGKTMGTCVDSCGQAESEYDRLYDSYTDQTDPGGAKRKKALNDKEEARKYGHKCERYAANVTSMASQVAVLGQTALAGLQCASNTASSTPYPTATPVSLTTGTFDCSNAAFAATNAACICAANPGDAICAQSLNGSTNTTPGLTGGRIATPGDLNTSADDMSPIDQTNAQGKGQSGTNAGGGGASGGGAGGGSGGGAPLGAEGDGLAASGIDKNVITGTSGGSGGIGALGATGGGGGGYGGGGSKGSGSGGGGGYDPSKWAPKSIYRNRGLAGMSVPATDGVTGPAGPSIWEKVHTRYEVKKSTLIQDK